MLHGRCKSMEQMLRLQIQDQKDEIDKLREREKDLLDRLLAYENPASGRVLAQLRADYKTTAAPPMPEMPRGGSIFQDPLRRPVVEAARPALTPEDEQRFRYPPKPPAPAPVSGPGD